MRSPTRFVKRCASLTKETVVGRPDPAVEKGSGGYADWVMTTILYPKDREEETYPSVIEWLAVADDVRRQLDLTRAQLPDHTTVQKAFNGLTMALVRRLLQ